MELLPQVGPSTVLPMEDALKADAADLITTKNPKFQYLDPLLSFLMPLDQYYQKYNWHKYVAPFTTSQSIRNGHIYEVTLYVEGPGVGYRPSVLTKLGIDTPPKTWAEFIDLLARAKRAGKAPMVSGVTPLSFLVMLHNMIWASQNPASIANIIFGNAKWTDGPCAEAADVCVKLWKDGYIDHDSTAISITAAYSRFAAGDAVLNISGTWSFSTMQTSFGQDYGLLTVPSPTAGPTWSLGEDQSQSIPLKSNDPDTAAAVLNYCITGEGASVFAQQGNLMATAASTAAEKPQVRVVPTISPNIAVYLYGWLPLGSQNAWMNGFSSVLQGSTTPGAWASQIQSAWERDQQSGNLPSLAVRRAIPH